jgi:hypothetical protein
MFYILGVTSAPEVEVSCRDMTIWALWFNIDSAGVSAASVASGVTTGNFGPNQFLYFSF